MITLADLEALDRTGLAALWSDLLGGEVPPKMSQPMQRRFLAYELQARRHGELPAALLARLARIAQGEERKATPALQTGTRLLRAWNGTTHVVDVLPDGFLWNGARHRSLSAIARAITGARWSGPRFFGLVAAAETAARSEAGRKRGGLDRGVREGDGQSGDGGTKPRRHNPELEPRTSHRERLA